MSNAPLPPENIDAEESLLGAVLMSGKAIEAAVEEGVTPDDFSRRSHGVLFRTAVEMYDAGDGVDALTVIDRLTTTGKLADIDAERVHEIAAFGISTGNTRHYARIITETAAMRRLITAGNEIAQLAWAREGTAQDILSKAEAALTNAVRNTQAQKAEEFTSGLDELVGEIRSAYLSQTPIFGTKTGMRQLDTMLSGLWPGQLILVAARPGNGKSAWALNVAENLADFTERVMYVSLEMSKRELQIRSLARAAQVDSRVLGTGQLTVDQAGKFKKGIETVKSREGMLHIQDDGAATISTIRSEARRLARTPEGLSLIVVDYLQLMNGAEGTNRNDQISVISRNLKLIARELEIPVIALSQMNREVIHRAGNRPQLSDLRDSGSLEQDADVVIFLHTDSDYDSNKEPDGSVELIVAKNRRGATGTVEMQYNRAWNRFGDAALKEAA